jgi:hypothetical protein
MKLGTSIIRLAVGLLLRRLCSRLSLNTLSEASPPPSGHTWPTASSSWATSSCASGRNGNSVSRVAMTSRLGSIIGE